VCKDNTGEGVEEVFMMFERVERLASNLERRDIVEQSSGCNNFETIRGEVKELKRILCLKGVLAVASGEVERLSRKCERW
jgi:hypothetical protein